MRSEVLVAIDPTPNDAAATWEATESLVPWDMNPRKNDGAPVEAVKQSIRRFGFAAPIIALEGSRMIVAGHTRWKAATDLGLANVPVRFVDLDEGEAVALALADNKLGEMAEWDDDALAEILADFDRSNLSELGWGESELKALLDTEDFEEVVWKEFDETIADEEEDDGKPVTCPDCGHGFRV